jgi:4-hydroxy-tetrahydrodipicolinate reductase
VRIGLIGYGKMGKAIEALALKRGHSISFRSDRSAPFDEADLVRTDVAIEFTNPDSAADNILRCVAAGTPVVSGSTGWFQRLDEVKDEVLKLNGTLFYGTNFSVGMNIVFRLNRELAALMNHFPDYEPAIEEIHHIHKKDSPSGTALTLAEDLLFELKRKNRWAENEPSEGEVLGIRALREGEVPGSHHVTYTSSIDKITLSHEAFGRDGFALGAVLAAEFAKERHGIYTMKDLLNHENRNS